MGAISVMNDWRVLIPVGAFESLLGAVVTEDRTNGAIKINYSSYFPTDGWLTSSPEEQGISSYTLTKLLNEIKDQQLPQDSLLVTRNGYLVSETYFYPTQQDTKHMLFSCTKSVVSALCGIAIEEGYIEGADQPVLSFYPELDTADADPNLKKMTVEHLLTMTAGLNRLDGIDQNELNTAKDLPAYVLALPMFEEPGASFYYDNFAPHILMGILNRATGKNVEEYAKEKLFGPLGITDYVWSTDQNGLQNGGYGIEMTPQDMAKFGYLYLKDGKWEGKQIVPRDWVQSSGEAKVKNGDRGYGYLWWIEPNINGFSAQGANGQMIFVMPDYNAVVVITGSAESQLTRWLQLVNRFITPSMESIAPLPEDRMAHRNLTKLSEELGKKDAEPVSPLPNTASEISDKQYIFTDEAAWFKELAFNFNGTDTCTMTADGKNLIVGLDGVYRITENEACYGRWLDDTTFELTMTGTNLIWPVKLAFVFENNNISVTVSDKGGVYGPFTGTAK